MNLKEALRKHEMWLKGKAGGERANLSNTDLRDVNLKDVDLRHANLKDANLRGADLRNANLRNSNLGYADLCYADLRYADLSFADLSDANLSCADLRGADLTYTNLSDANLKYADLRKTNLRNTNLRGTNLSYAEVRNANFINVKTNMYTVGYNIACPEEGSFIGYKKADDYIIKLLILEDSKRSSSTTCKCRCDKAKVLEIKNIETGKEVMEVSSNYDPDFIYKVGEIVTVEDFDEDRWNECAPGIHFFVNKEDAINY